MEYAEYPKWQYHATKPACIVANEEEKIDLGDGWFDSPQAAVPVVDRDALIAQALALGIKIDQRWATQKIADLVADHKA